ncbi:MAG: aminoacyl-histidine dipeptidase [Clostridia bacterium]|nr:aminoacyl-histidine dipeptidase [Clostridia bacterium]
MEFKQNVTAGLEPALPLAYFEAISAVPRGSKHEEKIARFLCDFAADLGLEHKLDGANNVYIVKPATPGMEDKEPVSLQGHIDMVCEKNGDVEHDFENDGLDLYIEGGKLRARGTTLGGDDGAAVVYMMALLASDDVPHPRLECVFTADEEMGMGGADNFDFSQLTSRRMINIDSEDEGIVTVSCAGGVRTDIGFEVVRVPVKGKLLRVSVTGLAGGHSGGDIHLGRANAAVVLATILNDLYADFPFGLVEFSSGSKDNAIPREAEAVVALLDADKAKERLLAYEKKYSARLSKADKGFKLRVAKGRTDLDGMFTMKDTRRALSAVLLAPNGVLSMSQSVPGLVESSCNLGVVKTSADKFGILMLARSCDDAIVDEIMKKDELLAKLLDAVCEHHDRYPGWAYSGSSRLCDDYCRIYKEQTGRDAEVIAIHAGLECGLIKHALPDIDVISIGPDMENIHTPNEALDLGSFARTWELLKALVSM